MYLLASFSLLAMMTPQMMGVARMSREGADLRCAESFQLVVDSLHPGESVVLSLDAWPADDPLLLAGRAVSVYYGNGSIVLPVIWRLPDTTLSPTGVYRVWLAEGGVQVESLG